MKSVLSEKTFFVSAEKNGLSFLETSALDSTNVETAFQTILTGEWALSAGAVVVSIWFLIYCQIEAKSYLARNQREKNVCAELHADELEKMCVWAKG